MKMVIPFGPFAPNTQTFRNPGVSRATNVLPLADSYIPLKSLADITNALGGRALGFTVAYDQAGVDWMYAGDSTKLYEDTTLATFTDQSKGGGYATAAGDVWEIVDWNRNYKVIATNYTDAVQSMTTGGGGAGAFADMITGTNKPKAKRAGIVGNFVVLGYTNDATDGVRPSRVWWSAFGNQLNFDPDAATQSDYEDLASGGQVQRIIGGAEYGVVFQREMVRVMRYVGGAVVFELLPINYAPGTPLPQSVIAYGGRVFYIADDGFMMLDGVTPIHIGTPDIDQEFWNGSSDGLFTGISLQHASGYSWGMSATVDPQHKLVYWASTESLNSAVPNKLYIYNWEHRKWSTASMTVQLLCRTDTTSIVSRVGAFSSSNILGAFTGAPPVGTITTFDIQPQDGMRWQINGVRPLVDKGSSVSSALGAASVAARTNLYDTLTFGASAAQNLEGVCRLRSGGHYQQVRCSLSASFGSLANPSKYIGLEIEFELDGER